MRKQYVAESSPIKKHRPQFFKIPQGKSKKYIHFPIIHLGCAIRNILNERSALNFWLHYFASLYLRKKIRNYLKNSNAMEDLNPAEEVNSRRLGSNTATTATGRFDYNR